MAGNAQWGSSVTVANEYTLTGLSSLWGTDNAGVAAKEVRKNAALLSGRTTLFLQAHPDNTGYIYVGFDNTVSAANYAMVLTAGDAKQVTIPATANLKVWVLGSAAAQAFGFIEGKP